MAKKTLFILSLVFSSYSLGQTTFTLQDTIFTEGSVCQLRIHTNINGRGYIAEYSQDLDSLLDFFATHKNILFELGIHTDIRGSEEGNLKMSENRAKYLCNFFISKGVDSLQIVPKGYGEFQPIISIEVLEPYKTTDKQKFEELSAVNRRTELKIVKIKN